MKLSIRESAKNSCTFMDPLLSSGAPSAMYVDTDVQDAIPDSPSPPLMTPDAGERGCFVQEVDLFDLGELRQVSAMQPDEIECNFDSSVFDVLGEEEEISEPDVVSQLSNDSFDLVHTCIEGAELDEGDMEEKEELKWSGGGLGEEGTVKNGYYMDIGSFQARNPGNNHSKRAAAIKAEGVIKQYAQGDNKVLGKRSHAHDILMSGPKEKKPRNNAENAKMNREKHKAYVAGMEKEVDDLKDDKLHLENIIKQKDAQLRQRDRQIAHLQRVLQNDSKLASIIEKVAPKAKVHVSKSSANDHDYDFHGTPPNTSFLGSLCLTVKDEANVAINTCVSCGTAAMKQEDEMV